MKWTSGSRTMDFHDIRTAIIEGFGGCTPRYPRRPPHGEAAAEPSSMPFSGGPGSPRNSFHAALAQLAQLDKSDLDLALREILEVDAEQLGVGRVSYWDLAPDHSAIHCRLLYQRTEHAYHSGAELRAEDFPRYFGAILESHLISASDAWTDPRTHEFTELYFKPNDIRAMLDVPVWRRGKLAGVVCHEHLGDPRAWTLDEHGFALGIANCVSVALELHDRLRAELGYALLARASNDVLWDWDMTRDVIEWNDALCSLLRHRPEDVNSSLQWWVEQVHPDDRVRVKDGMLKLIHSGGGLWTEQYRWIRGDGSIATVLDRGYVVRDDRGKPVRMVGSMVDITERVEMQARLALSDRMASIGTLAAGVAHEINNPLTYIKANLTCAIEDVRSGSDPHDIITLLREAEEGADRVRRIVQDLQIFSRPREQEVEDLDVRAVIDSSINMAWNVVRHRAQLVKDYGELPHVRMNRARLGQVILNVLMNAAHAIEEGHVDRNLIKISTRTGPIGEAVIEITDSGSGIPPEILPRMFEPFFTTKPVGVGTGLGLSICHSIVTAAGGTIGVESPTSGGCRIVLTLPAVRPRASRTLPVEAGFEGPRRRVLLIDDEPMIRRAMRRILEPQHEVVLADSCVQAFEMMNGGPPIDVIVCDVMMPNMTGMELYERLVAEHSPLAERIIFMTGGAFSERSSQLLADCRRPVIEKPIERSVLLRALAAIELLPLAS
ncbi:MAG: ATP-binding protein [Kofleriaceae bacterium]